MMFLIRSMFHIALIALMFGAVPMMTLAIIFTLLTYGNVKLYATRR